MDQLALRMHPKQRLSIASNLTARPVQMLYVVAVFAACAPPFGVRQEDISRGTPVQNAALPTRVAPYQEIEQALYCVRQTKALKGVTFVVGPFADSTGKINSVAMGATGNFIPQGGSASYITDAVTLAGGRVVSTYFGQPAVKVPASYAINGIFNSLDFGAPFSMDMRVAGIGPLAEEGWAQLSLTIQLDEASTRVNHQISMIQRTLRYRQRGIGIGADPQGVLVTGSINSSVQERLQLESINGPIALGVLDVLLREFPDVHDQCKNLISDLF